MLLLNEAGAFAEEFARPVLIAVTYNLYEAAQLLCKLMKDPFRNRTYSKVALDIARAWKNDEMFDLVKSYM